MIEVLVILVGYGVAMAAMKMAVRLCKGRSVDHSKVPVIPWRGNDLEWYQANADRARAQGDEGSAQECELIMQEAWEDEAQVFADRIVPADAWGR